MRLKSILAELRNLNESATKGRAKSQRGGNTGTGTHKTWPSYDDLTITQWVSGFTRCMQEEKS